jgi:hypothetical protein
VDVCDKGTILDFRRALGLRLGNVFVPYVVGSLVVCGLVALAIAAAFALGLDPAIAWPVGLTMMAAALFFVALFVYLARQEVRAIADLLTGEIWVRWSYDTADLERLASADWERTQTMVRQSAGSAVLAGSLAGGTFVVSGMGVAASAAFGGAIAGLLAVIALVIYVRGRSCYAARVRQGREVIFGPRAILRDNVVIALSGKRARLRGLEVEAATESAPASLRVNRQVERRTTTTFWWEFSRRYWAEEATEIAIPLGREDEAAALADRYHRAYSLDEGRRVAQGGVGRRSGLSPRPS